MGSAASVVDAKNEEVEVSRRTGGDKTADVEFHDVQSIAPRNVAEKTTREVSVK